MVDHLSSQMKKTLILSQMSQTLFDFILTYNIGIPCAGNIVYIAQCVCLARALSTVARTRVVFPDGRQCDLYAAYLHKQVDIRGVICAYNALTKATQDRVRMVMAQFLYAINKKEYRAVCALASWPL